VWAIFYQRMHTIQESFGLMRYMDISLALSEMVYFKSAVFLYFITFAIPLVPYFLYRNRFVRYKVYDDTRDFVLRRFVNYYLRIITRNIIKVDGPLIDKLAAASVAEAEAAIVADDLLQEKVREQEAIEAKKPKYLIYKKQIEKFDFDSQIPIKFRSSTAPYQKHAHRESDY